ncbi:MAG: hypothetical protein WBQ86_06995 [Candidatus Binatus sp.]
MAAERGLNLFRRESLTIVNAKSDGALLWEELGIQARLVIDQKVMRNFEFQPPGHFNYESGARKAGIQSLLRPRPEHREEAGRVELLQRHIFATAEQSEGTPFTRLLDLDTRLREFGNHIFNRAIADCVKAHLVSGKAAAHKGNHDRTDHGRAGRDRAHVIARLERIYLLFKGRYAEQTGAHVLSGVLLRSALQMHHSLRSRASLRSVEAAFATKCRRAGGRNESSLQRSS